VEKGSRAEKAGFRAGDIVLKVNGQAVHDTSDFAHGVKSRSGDSVPIVIMRDKKEQTITLSLPARKESGDLFEEESFDSEPVLSAEARVRMSKLREELAQLRPEMLQATENFRKAQEKGSCQQQREFQRQKARMQRDMQKLRRELLLMKEDWL
jgi:hypothetical protein